MLTNKSRGKGSIGGAIRHLDKHKESAEISKPELSHLNRSLTKQDFHKPTFKECKTIALDFEKKHNKAVDEWNQNNPDKKQKRHLKKDTSQFFEAVYSYSPEANGTFDYMQWVKQTVLFAANEYKDCKLIRAELHMDEETPHVHIIMASFDNEKQNCTTRNILGNKEDLCLLQDRYADKMKQFNLERGHSRYREYNSIKKRAEHEGLSVKEYSEKYNIEIPKKRRHKSIRQWKAEQNAMGMTLERRNKELSDKYQRLMGLIEEMEKGYVIPDRYIDTLDKIETYEGLLNIGSQLNITVGDTETTLTDMLWDCREQDNERLDNLIEENYYDDFSL